MTIFFCSPHNDFSGQQNNNDGTRSCITFKLNGNVFRKRKTMAEMELQGFSIKCDIPLHHDTHSSLEIGCKLQPVIPNIIQFMLFNDLEENEFLDSLMNRS